MFTSAPLLPTPGSAHGDAEEAVDPCRTAAAAAPVMPALSASAAAWLKLLEDPRSWVDSPDPARQAEFLLKLAALAYDIGAIPPEHALRVSWVSLNRLGPSQVFSCELPPASDGQPIAPTGRHPWLCFYVEYDGEQQLGLGEVTLGPDGGSAVLDAHWSMSPCAAGHLLALLGRQGHVQRGSAEPMSCQSASTLRLAMARHLENRPALAEALTRSFPLRLGLAPVVLSEELQAISERARRGQLNRRTTTLPADYRVPVDVMRVLIDPELEDVLHITPIQTLAKRLKLSPTTLRLNLDACGRRTVLGRQSERPDLVRHAPAESAARRLRDGGAATVDVFRDMHRNGECIASALSAGTEAGHSLRFAYWTGPQGDPG